MVRPAVLGLAYAVAIAVQGSSWLWVPIAWLLLIEFGELAAVGCWGAVWVRLVIMSGLYGLYQSVWVRLDGFGIFSGLLSMVLGYFFSKQLNAFFFFVTQYTSRRQFRHAST